MAKQPAFWPKAEEKTRYSKHLFQILSGIGSGSGRHLLRGAADHDIPALVAPLRPQIHNVVRGFDHIQVMLDHNHRIAAVSGKAIPFMDSHVHNITFRTDSYDGHYHEFCGTSSPAIPVGDGRHVHFAKAYTSYADGHAHEFRLASLINDPISEC